MVTGLGILFSQDLRVNEGFSFSPSQKMSTVILVLAVTLLKSNKCAPANRSKPKWSSKFCTHQFSGAMLVVGNVYVQRKHIVSLAFSQPSTFRAFWCFRESTTVERLRCILRSHLMLQAITDNDYDKLTAAVSAAKEPHQRHIWEPEWRWRDVVHKGAGDMKLMLMSALVCH